MNRKAKITCQCGNSFEVQMETPFAAICQACGSGNITFSEPVQQVCVVCNVTRESNKFLPCKCINSRVVLLRPAPATVTFPTELKLDAAEQTSVEDTVEGKEAEEEASARSSEKPTVDQKSTKSALGEVRGADKSKKPDIRHQDSGKDKPVRRKRS